MATVRVLDEAVRVENIYCIGRNYAAHIRELNHQTDSEMTAFMKPTSSLLNAGGYIRLPEFSKSVHFECELLLLVGKNGNGMTRENALDYVAGFGVGLDLTARDVQNIAKDKGLPWLKAKGFHTAACVSDFLPLTQLPAKINDVHFTLTINQKIRQHGHTANMLYPVEEILCNLNDIYGLQNGDVIFTGTPEGVGELQSGEVLSLDLQGVIKTEFTVA